MELFQIRYFLALCDTLNFARAAERCHVSQPSLTRAVQKLERELGGLLVRRERKRTHLTPLGKLVRPMLTEVLSHAERTRGAAKSFMNVEGLPLRLGIGCSIGLNRLAAFLMEVCRKNPKMQLSIVDTDPQHMRELLLEGEIDAAIWALPAERRDGLTQMVLYGERYVVVFPQGHRFEHLEAVPFYELASERLVLHNNHDMFNRLSAASRGDLRVTCWSDRMDWIHQMIAAGLGITIAAENSNFGPRSLTRPLTEPELTREISLVTVPGRPFGQSLSAVVRAVRAYNWQNDEEIPVGPVEPLLVATAQTSAQTTSVAIKRIDPTITAGRALAEARP